MLTGVCDPLPGNHFIARVETMSSGSLYCHRVVYLSYHTAEVKVLGFVTNILSIIQFDSNYRRPHQSAHVPLRT